MGRRLTTALDRLHPDSQDEVRTKQEKQSCDQDQAPRQFQPNDSVFARSYTGARWMPAVVERATGPVSYSVRAPDGQMHRRHVDQLRGRALEEAQGESSQLLSAGECLPQEESKGAVESSSGRGETMDPVQGGPSPVSSPSPSSLPVRHQTRRPRVRPKGWDDYEH